MTQPRKPRKVQTPVLLDPTMIERLDAVALQERRSRSELIRIAIEQYLETLQPFTGQENKAKINKQTP